MNASRSALCAFAVVAAACIRTTVFAGSLELVPAESVGMSSERLDRLREHFQQLVNDEKTGGVQIIISRRGRVVMHENLGYADIENNVAMNDDTLFRIFSMTKPVIAVAMMMLYEEGHYSLSDPLSKHIPRFAGLRVYAGENDSGGIVVEDAIREPTIHDLLQHTAGFTYGLFTDTAIDRLYNDADLLDYDSSLDTMIGKLSGFPLLYQPGTRTHYSVAVDVQAYLIEQWSGMDIESFLAARLFTPLGMDETVSWAAPEQLELLATVYTHDDSGRLVPREAPIVDNFERPPGLFSGGYQLISTGDDYWRFAQMLLNRGTLDGNRVLARPTVEMMTSNRLPLSIPERSAQPGRGYGFNLAVVTDPTIGAFPVGQGEYSHSGLATTTFYVDPEEAIVAIFLTQYLPYSLPPYEDALHRLVRAAIID